MSINIKISQTDFKLHPHVIICTLTLHHFNSFKIKETLKLFIKQTSIGIIINDLHRNVLAYWLFKLYCTFLVSNKIAEHDGLVSISKGFTKKELTKFSKDLSIKNQYIRWKWAFRYQWVLQH